MTSTTDQRTKLQRLELAVRSTFRGVGQVMFQQSAWTGLVFLLGIFWGSYECHLPQVAWGCLVGVVVSTFSGWLMEEKPSDGSAGLWGFNGALVGCGFPTFMGNTWYMWVCLIFAALMSTWLRRGLNNIMASWKINSLTFPFVFITWVFLFAAHAMDGLPHPEMSVPSLPEAFPYTLDTSFPSLVIYWLKGISQVFLIDSWVTGIFFLVALALCSGWAAFWASVASAISLGLAILFKADPSSIANGLYGFSAVLTGIAVGMTFYQVCYRSAMWTVAAIIATVFVQAAMNVILEPYGLPTLTGPFCVTTWLFLLPVYKLSGRASQEHQEWLSDWDKFVHEIDHSRPEQPEQPKK